MASLKRRMAILRPYSLEVVGTTWDPSTALQYPRVEEERRLTEAFSINHLEVEEVTNLEPILRKVEFMGLLIRSCRKKRMKKSCLVRVATEKTLEEEETDQMGSETEEIMLVKTICSMRTS